jgi:hypothetical protein
MSNKITEMSNQVSTALAAEPSGDLSETDKKVISTAETPIKQLASSLAQKSTMTLKSTETLEPQESGLPVSEPVTPGTVSPRNWEMDPNLQEDEPPSSGTVTPRAYSPRNWEVNLKEYDESTRTFKFPIRPVSVKCWSGNVTARTGGNITVRTGRTDDIAPEDTSAYGYLGKSDEDYQKLFPEKKKPLTDSKKTSRPPINLYARFNEPAEGARDPEKTNDNDDFMRFLYNLPPR